MLSWLMWLLLIFFIWFIRSLVVHSGCFFSSVHFVFIMHFFSLCLICFLNACLPSLLPNLCTNMWRRSRAPCSCLNCISKELREKFRALWTDVRRIEEHTDARHRELQHENQGIREDLACLQTQLQQQEILHNQELAIVLRGVNRNTRQLGVVTQQLENPQQPANSARTSESRIPSSFHSISSNDHHSVPSDPGYTNRHYAEENPADANPEAW